MNTVELSALDGTNPQAWLAALGLFVTLEATRTPSEPPIRLGWRYRGRWLPFVVTDLDETAVIARVRRDLEAVVRDPAFIGLRYAKGGKGPIQRDLKPPPGFFSGYLCGLINVGASTASLRLAASFATDVAVDGKGNTKPTALHFTAGQQQFMAIADELAAKLDDDDVHRALFTGWTYERATKTFGWDASSYRDYALRADDPGSARKGTVPGADWLALRGVSLLACAPHGTSILTPLCHGSGNSITMRWPLWEHPLLEPEITSLISLAEMASLSPFQRRSRGITVVLESAVVRSDQGYGSFAPPSMVQLRKPICTT